MKIWTRIVLLTAIAAGPSLADDLHDTFILPDNHGRGMGIVERGRSNEMIRKDAQDRRSDAVMRVEAAQGIEKCQSVTRMATRFCSAPNLREVLEPGVIHGMWMEAHRHSIFRLG